MGRWQADGMDARNMEYLKMVNRSVYAYARTLRRDETANIGWATGKKPEIER